MPITLGGVTLPSDLVWVDEFDWTPVEQAQGYTLDGALVIDTAERQAGRPITLEGAEDRGWVTRATVQALYALAQAASPGMALELADGRAFTVVLRHQDRPLEARQVLPVCPPAAGSYYVVTVRLTAV